MNTTMKSICATCSMIASISMPLIAGAANSVFSGKEAYVAASVSDGVNYSIRIRAFENASKSKSAKGSSSGAYIEGYIFDEDYFYYFWGETTTIEFNATKTGGFPEKVTASGSIPGTWYPFCYDVICDYDSYEDTVQFSVDAEAVTDQVVNWSGTRKSDYGTLKQNAHYNQTFAPAVFNDLSVTSRFDTLNTDTASYTFGEVGKSKSHSVEITK
ncbi:hypothetical protein [Methylosarcina fibrata]|uniref:hypothetical protein n=1 Tax=Methylosarcina fibrata TaxID=105972 RepID=UPI00037AA336|nr:hypothetical protein [Methylosarcina fibrata]